MKTVVQTIAAILLGSFFTITAGEMAIAESNPREGTAMEEKSVSAAFDNFYVALNLMFKGEGQAMKDAWSHADDITYMGPAGNYLVGWTQIEGEWDTQTAAKLGGKVTPQNINMIVVGDMALANCIEAGENVVDGKTETVSLRSSTVFRKESGAWKIIGHQTDLLGYMNPAK